LWWMFGPAMLMTFLVGLTCYANDTVHRFTVCFWRKSYQKCWRKSHCQSRETCGSSTTWLWLICTSGPRTSYHHLQWLLDWIGWANGLVSQVTGPHTNGLLPVGP
jgi:hypothetical protein